MKIIEVTKIQSDDGALIRACIAGQTEPIYLTEEAVPYAESLNDRQERDNQVLQDLTEQTLYNMGFTYDRTEQLQEDKEKLVQAVRCQLVKLKQIVDDPLTQPETKQQLAFVIGALEARLELTFTNTFKQLK